MDGVDPGHDPHSEQQCRDVASQPNAAGREIHRRAASCSLAANRNGPIRCPQMAQQERNLLVREGEHLSRQVLLMGALAEYPQVTQPQVYARRMPAVSVATEDQLVPAAPAGVPIHGDAELVACGRGDDAAVLLGGGRIAQRLMNQVAAVAYQVTEKRQSRVRPGPGPTRLGDPSGNGETIAERQLFDADPSASPE